MSSLLSERTRQRLREPLDDKGWGLPSGVGQVRDDEAIEWALAYRVNAEMGDIEIAHGCIGSMLDPSVPLSSRDIVKYGQGRWSPVLIDATINWELEPQEQYDENRYPRLASEISPKMKALLQKRWSEYGLGEMK